MSDTKRLSGLSILVVEDDYYMADDTRRALREEGAEILGPCATFEDAERLVGSTTPDCAVLDINLGGGPEFKAARAMLERGVPVVFVTGYDTAVLPPDLAHIRCLQKPARVEEIVKAVGELGKR